MTGAEISQLVMSLGVLPGLFVWLLFDVRKEQKKDREEARDREAKLLEHISKSDITQDAIMRSIERISLNMGVMQQDIAILKDKVN